MSFLLSIFNILCNELLKLLLHIFFKSINFLTDFLNFCDLLFFLCCNVSIKVFNLYKLILYFFIFLFKFDSNFINIFVSILCKCILNCNILI